MSQDKKEPQINRRNFLKLAGIGTLAAGAIALTKIDPFKSIINGPDLSEVPFEIPPQLENVTLPEQNENLKNPIELVENAIRIYQHWQTQNKALKDIIYLPPENYLSLDKLDDNLLRLIQGDVFESKDYDGLIWKLSDLVYSNDTPFSSYMIFASADIYNPTHFIKNEPGSGLGKKIRENVSKNHPDEYDLYADAQNDSINPSDIQTILQTTDKFLKDTINYIKDVGDGKPLSTSILFAYYLHQNQGDIVSSLFDTTIFLKLCARNNLKTLEFEATREGAELLNELFIDEFSTKIPFDWLLENVPKNDPVLNTATISDENDKYKDFMPINRAGQFYHAWNIIASSACIHPIINQQMTKTFYIHDKLGGEDMRVSNGRVKVESDMRVADQSSKLNTLWKKFKTKRG